MEGFVSLSMDATASGILSGFTGRTGASMAPARPFAMMALIWVEAHTMTAASNPFSQPRYASCTAVPLASSPAIALKSLSSCSLPRCSASNTRCSASGLPVRPPKPPYTRHTDAASPIMRVWPFSIQMTLLHKRSTWALLWDTMSTVTPCFSISSLMRSSHFFWNMKSPTESTSSTTRISGTITVAIANAMRATMPEE